MQRVNKPLKPAIVLSLLLVFALLMAACEIESPGPVVREPTVRDPAVPGERIIVEEDVQDDIAAEQAARVGVPGNEVMMLASRFLGRGVENRFDENLGEVEDLLIDMNTGNVLFAVVEHGGFLDIGDDELPVPLSAFRVTTADDDLILDIDEDTLQTFPDIPDDWPADFAPGWADTIARFWQAAGFSTDVLEGADLASVVRADDLVGYGVNTFATPGVGNVRDLVVDLNNSRVQYVVMSVTDAEVFDVGWRLVPVSAFDATRFGEQLAFTEDLDGETLRESPHFPEATLFGTNFFDPTWDDEIARYWRAEGFDVPRTMTEAETPQEQQVTERAETDRIFVGTHNRMVPATQLMDRELQSMTGEMLGSIDDLLIDLRTGRVLYAVVQHGGFLGVGDDEVPVPLHAMQWGPEGDLMIGIPEESWQAYSDAGEDWTIRFTRERSEQIRTFWTEAGFDIQPAEGVEAGQIVRASTLIDTEDMTDTAGAAETRGFAWVRDLIVDLSSSQIKYALMSFQDTDTFGDQPVFVPYGALEPTAEGRWMLAQDLDPALLQGAPSLADGDLSNVQWLDRGWDDEVEAYWSEAGYGFEGT